MSYNQSEFLKKFHVSEDVLRRSGLSWQELIEIKERYTREMKELSILASFIAEHLLLLKKVHSIKKRVKDPWHLIRKIIWKSANRPDLKINPDNYQQVISDLIGVRVLHLFKDDWESIHYRILDKWLLRENPVANIRHGDSVELTNRFRQLGLDVLEHKFGYRSIHYQILLIHNKKEITAEIQVRTLFEEAWSEIDHELRYPDNTNDPLLTDYLVIYNRIVGSADEMGSFIRTLKKSFDRQGKVGWTAGREIDSIKNIINQAALDQNRKDEIYDLLDKIGRKYSQQPTPRISQQDPPRPKNSSGRSGNGSGGNREEKKILDIADSLTGLFDSGK